MAKRIIILDRQQPGVFRVAFWADVPAARQAFYATLAKPSAWTGASVAENTALTTGAVVEQVETISLLSGVALPQYQQTLVDRWTAFQADVTAEARWARYGSFWDGASWTAGGA